MVTKHSISNLKMVNLKANSSYSIILLLIFYFFILLFLFTQGVHKNLFKLLFHPHFFLCLIKAACFQIIDSFE